MEYEGGQSLSLIAHTSAVWLNLVLLGLSRCAASKPSCVQSACRGLATPPTHVKPGLRWDRSNNKEVFAGLLHRGTVRSAYRSQGKKSLCATQSCVHQKRQKNKEKREMASACAAERDRQGRAAARRAPPLRLCPRAQSRYCSGTRWGTSSRAWP